MPVVTTDVLAFTAAGLKTDFMEAYIDTQAQADWPKVATEIPTTLRTQNYGWLGRGAVMMEMTDRQQAQELLAKSYTISDKTYWGLMKVERAALEDDQYGVLRIRAQELGEEPNRHWDELTFGTLDAGFSSLCSDNQYFFDSDHSEGASGTQSNVTSSTLSDASLTAAEAAMMAYVDDKGKPMRIKPNLLVVGPALARRASDLVGSGTVVHNPGDGTAGSGATAYTNYSNYFRGRYDVLVTPYVSGYHWFLLDVRRKIKPIIMQSRSDVPISFETDMDTPQARIQEEYQFGARGRYNAGYGLWQTGYGSNASL